MSDHIRATAYQITLDQVLLQAMEVMQDIVFVHELPSMRVLYNNESVTQELLGYSPIYYFSKPNFISELALSEDRALVEGVIQCALKFGKAEITYRVKCDSGKILWIHARFKVLFDDEKNPLQLVVLLGNVTEKKTAENELRKSRAFLEAILNHTPFSISVRNRSGQYVHVNRSFLRLVNASQDAVLGCIPSDFFPSSLVTEFLKAEEIVWDQGQPVAQEMNMMLNGATRDFMSTSFPIKDDLGDVFAVCALGMDITEQKEAHKKLLQASKMSTLGEMAGGIAHEINNPLAIIGGKIGLMRRRIESGKALDLEVLTQDLLKVEQTSMRIAKIVKGLRSFARNADQDTMVCSSLDAIFEETLELCRERFRNNGIELDLCAAPNISIPCRSVQVVQVLLNLLNNAYDAVEKLEKKWVKVEAYETDQSLIISVTDSGLGIPPHVVLRLMQPFFTTKEVGKGTGLGLSISKGICEDHGGTLRYDESSPHTRFIIELSKAAEKLPVQLHAKPKAA